MTPTVARGNNYQGLGYYRSTAYGPTSHQLTAFLEGEAQSIFQLSISLRAKFEKLSELMEMCTSCSGTNWDGESAKEIPQAAYFEAARFVRLLPTILPLPEIVPEPNGQIAFEWHVKRDYMFVVALGGTQTLTFAGLFGADSSVHGTEPFSDSIPASIVGNLHRLLGE